MSGPTDCACVGYTIRTDYGTGTEHDVDPSSCPVHGGALTDAEDAMLADWWVSEGGDHEDLALDGLTTVVERIVAARLDAAKGLGDPFTAISTMLDVLRPADLNDELQMWRRVTKVCEESGEVWRALSGYVAENPRKGQTHTLDDLRGELFDTASAALCAVAHLDGNEGDPVAALIQHATGTADRLRAATAGR